MHLSYALRLRCTCTAHRSHGYQFGVFCARPKRRERLSMGSREFSLQCTVVNIFIIWGGWTRVNAMVLTGQTKKDFILSSRCKDLPKLRRTQSLCRSDYILHVTNNMGILLCYRLVPQQTILPEGYQGYQPSPKSFLKIIIENLIIF